jgi:hypothetical protein
MTELLFVAGLTALAAGLLVGHLKQLWLIANLATAGAAALAAFALQCGTEGCGAAPAGAALEGLVFVEVVVFATIGSLIGRRWPESD